MSGPFETEECDLKPSDAKAKKIPLEESLCGLEERNKLDSIKKLKCEESNVGSSSVEKVEKCGQSDVKGDVSKHDETRRHSFVELRQLRSQHPLNPFNPTPFRNLKREQHSVVVEGRVIMKQLKHTTNREGNRRMVLYLLLTDGDNEISCQAWGEHASLVNQRVEVEKVYEIKEIDVILRHTFKETYSWTELAPYKQLLQLQVNNRTRFVESSPVKQKDFPMLRYRFTAFEDLKKQVCGTVNDLIFVVENTNTLTDTVAEPYLVVCNSSGMEVTVNNLSDVLDQWLKLVIKSFETVVAMKGVQFIDVTKDDEGTEIINCRAFQDTIISLGEHFEEAQEFSSVQ